MSHAFVFTRGTHRIASPQATLARVMPVAAACGITRVTEVTGLDRLGVPVFCAIRPNGVVLQVSNGKGMSADCARVSAVMEAIELHHAENPRPERLRLASAAELAAEGATVLAPPGLPGYAGAYCAPTFRFEWIRGSALDDGTPAWAPASVACFARIPAPLVTDTNGLASGNHLLEASLHALYELVERDALAGLSVDGRLAIRGRCAVVDPATIAAPELHALVSAIAARDTHVVLIRVPSRVAVHTFWCVLVNRRGSAAVSTLNLGAGCHHDADVAAARAVTEAAQSRLTFIHGAREDRVTKPVDQAGAVHESAAYRYFARLQPDTAWSALPRLDDTPRDLEATHARLVGALAAAGVRAWQFDLTHDALGIPVVKVVAPALAFNRRLL
ncbi:MAG: YcaO-like family protein [Gammaproteobacteria bacterium]